MSKESFWDREAGNIIIERTGSFPQGARPGAVDSTIRTTILILLACTSLLFVAGPSSATAQPPTPRGPIEILRSGTFENFTSANGVRSGTGLPGDPYIISDWLIVTNSSFGIHLKNTNKFFIIRNVIIERTNSTGESEGIWLDNASNGRIENSDMSGFFYGIWLSLGSPNIITSNSLHNNTNGLYVTGSNEGISNNHIYHNTRYGAWITNSYNNVFTGNNVSANGNGRGGACAPSCDGEGFVVSGSNNNLFYNNTLVANDWYGFRTIFSQSNTYKNNYVAQNQFGIIFTDSIGHQIFQNNITNNDFGVGLEGGNQNSNVTANRIISSNPNSYGIYVTRLSDPMSTTGNIIYNNYLQTSSNAYDDWNYTSGELPDSWNVTRRIGTNILGGPFIGGNFYSNYAGSDPDQDGIGNAPYSIIGLNNGHNILDQLPLFPTQPTVIHDVAVTSVTASPNNAPSGTSISITVAVSNLGTTSESFSVNVTYSLQASSLSTLITTRAITSLSANSVTSFTTTWTTTGLGAGTYIVGAVASTVTGETYTINNACCTPATVGQTIILTVTGNQSPTAQFIPSTTSSVTGQIVSFDASTSMDPDGTISSYSWNFGDGATGSGATATHSYNTAGTYTVTLTVIDNLGAISTPATALITVSQASNLPGSPASFTLSAANGKATLTWTAPSNSGGSAIIKYRIYRGTSNSSLTWIANTTSTTYEDATVSEGQSYFYQVTAVNAAGVESPRTISQDVLVPAGGSGQSPDFILIIIIAGVVVAVAISAVGLLLRRRPKAGQAM